MAVFIIPQSFNNPKPAQYWCSTISSTKSSNKITSATKLPPAALFSNFKDYDKKNKKQLRNHAHVHATNTKELVADNQQGLGIVHFLKGKHFLITGATGFLGKVLVEKILRDVPDVGKIYLLIKAQNTEAAMQRLKNEIMNVELFKIVRETHGESYESFMLSKLVPVVGNICNSNIGLQDDLATTIAQQVDIIVNSAANTNFTERYDIALNINTRSSSHLIDFAKSCKKLKLFLHVSTAYVNGERQGIIMEKPFCMGDSIAREKHLQRSLPALPPILDVEGEMKIAFQDYSEVLPKDSSWTQKMQDLGLKRAKEFGWQDTYVFTKAMAEMMINNMRGDIPVVIIRPSIIESSWKSPFPGWIEGNRMMDPVIMNYGKGKLPGLYADPNVVLDIIPVDMVVNTMLAAIAKHGSMEMGGINVYQVGTSVANPVTTGDLFYFFYQHFKSSPCTLLNGKPIRVSPFEIFNSMEQLSEHIRRHTTTGNDLQSAKLSEYIIQKSIKLAEVLDNIYRPYIFYGGRFDISNTQKLFGAMCEEEKKKFDFEVGNINWKEYITNVHIPGLRKHVSKV